MLDEDPFHGNLHHSDPGHGARVEFATMPWARVTLIGLYKKSNPAAVEETLQNHLACALPTTGSAERSATHAVLWRAPGQYLALSAEDQPDRQKEFTQALDEHALIIDMSSALVSLRLLGTESIIVLARLCRLPLYSRTLQQNFSAATRIANIHAHIVRWNPTTGYDLFIPRSYCASMARMLQKAARHDSP